MQARAREGEAERSGLVGSLDVESSSHPHDASPPRRNGIGRHAGEPIILAFPSHVGLRDILERASDWPNPLFNSMFFALLGVVLIMGAVWAGEGGGCFAAQQDPPEAQHGLAFDWAGRPREVRGAWGAVATEEGRCSQAGADALADGGSAADAAVTAALCMGVVNAMSSGIGGGMIALAHTAGAGGEGGLTEVIEAREMAPAAGNETMFVGRPRAALEGGLAVAVPMELLGLHKLHGRHGRLPWARLLQPAIEYAGGFPAHAYMVHTLSSDKETVDALRAWPLLREIYTPGGRVPKVGEICCRNPALQQTLRRVAEEGPGVLYEGELAESLARDVITAGGVVTAADLAAAGAAGARVMEPLRGAAMGLEVLGPPPPSSGGAAIISVLQQLAGYDLPLPAAGYLGDHRWVEGLKHAFAMRMSLGDPAFVNVSSVLSDMTSRDFNDLLRRDATADGSTAGPEGYGGAHNRVGEGAGKEDHGTTHISVVDRDGNAVSMTTTINTHFGSKVVSPSTGIILNNEMDDFSIPGVSNTYGLAPSEANFVRPGKKPLSSMSPTIVMQGGRVRLVAGASGGPRIISATAHAILGVLARGRSPLEAIAAPQLHHQLLPNIAYEELAVDTRYPGGAKYPWGWAPARDPELAVSLRDRGHDVERLNSTGCVSLVAVDPDTGAAVAASDPRKDGAPAAEGGP